MTSGGIEEEKQPGDREGLLVVQEDRKGPPHSGHSKTPARGCSPPLRPPRAPSYFMPIGLLEMRLCDAYHASSCCRIHSDSGSMTRRAGPSGSSRTEV